jgi:hypothetical protein
MSLYKADRLETTPSGIQIANGREENPRFRRIYSAQVTDEVTIECEAYTMYGRTWRGELRQRNGDTVWFEPERPAKKILDRDLVPLIVRRCEEMFELDRAYMASNRPKIKTESGEVWEKA